VVYGGTYEKYKRAGAKYETPVDVVIWLKRMVALDARRREV
jgi:hypothetical protein